MRSNAPHKQAWCRSWYDSLCNVDHDKRAGGRSASGRQGPVVGRRPRGIRPLNPAEIVAHWDILRETCRAKHDLEAPSARVAVLDHVGSELAFALHSGVPDEVRCTTAAYPAVQQAIRTSALACQVVVLSPYLGKVTQQLLERSGISGASISTLCLQHLRASGDLEQHSAAQAGSCTGAETHVIADSLEELLSIRSKLLGLEAPGGAEAGLQRQWSAAALAREEAGVQESAEACSAGAFKLHLCEWGRATASMRAQVAVDASLHSMSEVQLATLLDVTDVGDVMDGVAWQ
jgi:hypothetical protein